MRKDKKAQLEDVGQLIAWVIALSFVFLIFFLVKTVKTTSLADTTQEIIESAEGDHLLIDFLKQKTKENSTENIAELIILYSAAKDESLFEEIEQKAKDYFPESFIESSSATWAFTLYNNEKKEIKRIEGLTDFQLNIGEKKVSSVILPSSGDEKKPITVEISKIKVGVANI